MDLDDRRLLTRPLSARQLAGLDVLAASAYTFVLAAMVLGRPVTAPAPDGLAPWVPPVVIAAMGIPLAVRRRWPRAVFAVVLVATLAALALGVVSEWFIGAAFALYPVAVAAGQPRRDPTRLVAVASLIGVVVLVGVGSPVPLPLQAGQIAVGAVVLGASWTMGRAVRERRQFERLAAAQAVDRAVAAERLRIARDLHDIVAHGLTLIVVRAGTANHVIATHPDEATRALEVIETTGRDALADMRRLLDVLRGDAAAGDTDLRPTPTVDQLAALVGRVAQAGVEVDWEVAGSAALSDSASVAVYRIAQEALTNVVKHAAPTTCSLRVAVADGQVRVDVTDRGSRAAPHGATGRDGRGLVGMRERVRNLGGSLEAGPLPEGGFRVLACFPDRPTTAVLP